MKFFLYPFLVMGTAAVIAAPPGPLTPDENQKMDQYREKQPDAAAGRELTPEEIAKRDRELAQFDKAPAMAAETRKLARENLTEDARLSETVRNFLKNSDSEDYARPATPEEIKQRMDEFSRLNRKLTSFYAEGGAYFASETGVFVVRKNIILRDPGLSLRCGEELYVILKKDPVTEARKEEEKRAQEAGSAGDTTQKEPIKMPDPKDWENSEVEYMSMTGGVIMKRINKRGEVEGAIGDKIVYIGETGDIIISGDGRKLIVSGDTRHETEGPGTYIRIYANGSIYVHGDSVTRMNSERFNLSGKDGKKESAKKRNPRRARVTNPEPREYATLEEEFSLEQTTPDSKLMVVSCKGFLFFDVEKDLIVCERDVFINEARFSMKCDNQMKVFLERDMKREQGSRQAAAQKKEEQRKKDELAGKAPKKDMVKIPDYEHMFFNGIASAAASGNVVMKRINDDGEVQGAAGELFTYDGKSGDVLMSGNGRKLLFSGESWTEIIGKGSYVRLMGNGDMNFKGEMKGVFDAREKEDGKSPLGRRGKKEKK